MKRCRNLFYLNCTALRSQLQPLISQKWCVKEVVDKYGEEEAYSKGFQVFTTVNSAQQATAVAALQQNLHGYDERHGFRGPVAVVWPASKQENPDGTVSFVEDKRLSDEAILAYLDEQDAIEKLVPAVVTAVQTKSAELMIAGGRKIELSWMV